MGKLKNSTVNQLKAYTLRYAGTDVEDTFVRRASLGELNFSAIQTEISVVLLFYQKLASIDLSNFPEDRLHILFNHIDQVNDQLTAITQFSVSSGGPAEHRANIITNFLRAYSALWPVIMEAFYFAEVTTAPKDITVYIQQMQEAQNDVAFQAQEFKKLIEQHTNTANQIVEKFGMQKYAKVFIDESLSFGKSAKSWLNWSLLALGFTITISIVLLSLSSGITDSSQLIHFTITKIVILTACFFGVSICFKNYRAQKHNEILNKHRHNALVTFEAFTAGKEDEQTKNAVLLAATQTIFGNQQTGYSNADSSDSDMPTRIIEIMKATPQK